MIDWIIAQQGMLSVTLALLIFTEHFLTQKLGASLTYKLWILIPVCLLLNNIPMSIIAIPSNDFSRYVVGITPTLTTRDAAPLFITWGDRGMRYCGVYFGAPPNDMGVYWQASCCTH